MPTSAPVAVGLSCPDIRTWHPNTEQRAPEGANKTPIGNKPDWADKRVVTEGQGLELTNELGIKFLETLAKVNDGVEGGSVSIQPHLFFLPFTHVDTKKTVILRTPSSQDPGSWSTLCSALDPTPS